MSQNDNEKKMRNKVIHIAFSEDEKEEIKGFAESAKMTTSEWIRQAIRDKIRRLKKPERYNQSNVSQISHELLLKISGDTKKILELQKEQENREEIYKNLLETSEAIQEEYKKLQEKGLLSDLSNERKIIKKLLTGHKSLTIKQISEMTDIESDKVIFVVTNTDDFKLNITSGRYSLR